MGDYETIEAYLSCICTAEAFKNHCAMNKTFPYFTAIFAGCLKLMIQQKKKKRRGGGRSPSAVPFFLTIYISAMLLGKPNKVEHVVAVK